MTDRYACLAPKYLELVEIVGSLGVKKHESLNS